MPENALAGTDNLTLASSPEQLLALPPEVLSGIQEAFALSLQTGFLLAIPLALARFALSWFLPQIALTERAAPRGAPMPEAETGLMLRRSSRSLGVPGPWTC